MQSSLKDSRKHTLQNAFCFKSISQVVPEIQRFKATRTNLCEKINDRNSRKQRDLVIARAYARSTVHVPN